MEDVRRSVGKRVVVRGEISREKYGIRIVTAWVGHGPKGSIFLSEHVDDARFPSQTASRAVEVVGVLARTPPYLVSNPAVRDEDLIDKRTGTGVPVPQFARSAGEYPGDYIIENASLRFLTGGHDRPAD